MVRKILIVPIIFFVMVFVVLSGCITESSPKTGSVQFASQPTGAQIYLDAQYRGSTPTTLTEIEAGTHAVELRYMGYENWNAMMTISPGANNVFVAMEPTPAGSTPTSSLTTTIVPTVIPSLDQPVSVTLNVAKDTMVIGDSQVFSGTATGTSYVLVTVYGTGKYTNGIQLDNPSVNELGAWKYTWNPGSSVLPGTYTVIVTDLNNQVSERKQFSVVGGGTLSITTNSYAAGKGDTLRFTGICTTGAPNVQLVLYGPGNYAGGVTLGTISVQANKNWEFRYTTDATMPTGDYTMYVYDVPKTSSSTVKFTVGYKQ